MIRPLAPVRRALIRPPIREPRFWVVQILVLALAAAHLAVDMTSPAQTIPAGVPVALLLAPVSYAALRFGLAGSVATALWATLLWLPDLLLPNDQGHVGNDLVELALVIAVAVFVGYHIDAERLERIHAERARGEQQATETRYRQLFSTNAAPIVVASQQGTILDANPAARALTDGDVIGSDLRAALGVTGADAAGTVIALLTPRSGLRHYRVNVAHVSGERDSEPLTQLVLLDVTEERAEGERVHRFAELLLQVQEDERRRIARELHDEPLQLLVHLARTLEDMQAAALMPPDLAAGLEAARMQTVDVASRIRGVVAGLRPPALEQLGLAPALRGFLAEVSEATGLSAELRILGSERRMQAEIELAAFRIAQEAVNNVVHHAAASKLVLTADFDGTGITLCVADDGRGFDTVLTEISAGRFGLLGMRERAALTGGNLTVRSAPGEGTVVAARLGQDGAGESAVTSR